MDEKQLIKHKIQQLVHLHAIYMHTICGLDVDQVAEYNSLCADWKAGLLTLSEIEEDINEYTRLRNESNY
jgi:hypothetical protein